MGKHDARLTRMERTMASRIGGPEAMLILELTPELEVAMAGAEKALGAPLATLGKEDKAGALWNARGDGEPGISGHPRSAWGRLATVMVLARYEGS